MATNWVSKEQTVSQIFGVKKIIVLPNELWTIFSDFLSLPIWRIRTEWKWPRSLGRVYLDGLDREARADWSRKRARSTTLNTPLPGNGGKRKTENGRATRLEHILQFLGGQTGQLANPTLYKTISGLSPSQKTTLNSAKMNFLSHTLTQHENF